jgi:hypothetical protein
MIILTRYVRMLTSYNLKLGFHTFVYKNSQNTISQSLKTIPNFNRDQLFYYPSFIL